MLSRRWGARAAPCSDDGEAERHREWIGRYEDASREFAVCRFVEAIGPGAVDPAVQSVFAIHAQRATGAAKLA